MTNSTTTRPFLLYVLLTLLFTLFWVLHYSFEYADTFLERIPNELWRNTYLLFVHFFFIEYVRRKFISGKSVVWLRFVVAFIIYVMALSWGLFAWREIGIVIGIYTSFRPAESIQSGVSYQAGGGFSAMLFYAITIHIYDFVVLRKNTRQLRFEKQVAELAYLKSQTNPHFLFNTLNNIYVLARDKSDLAPASILRLSQLLRFMLYESSASLGSIQQELKIIEDYIELEKLRYDKTLGIEIITDIDDPKQLLPPLLLVPLVENAFKHGVSETRQNPFIHIHLSIKNKRLTFNVKNSIEDEGDNPTFEEGIGLSNLRRQLELQFKEYNLEIKKGDGIFTLTMMINLASYVDYKLHNN